MNWIEPKEFVGMPKDVLELAQKVWIERYRDEVSVLVFPFVLFVFSYVWCLH